MSKKVLLNEFTSTELTELFKNKDELVAICTFGSCESHGWHCCLGPDYFVPTEIAIQAANRLENVVVLPCIPYGTSLHYNKYPMSVTLRFETVIAVAEDIFNSLLHHGIRRIYILNGHDGNIAPLQIAAHKVKDVHPEARFLYLPDWWVKVGERMGDNFEVWNGLGHGGEGETSIMMAIRPDLVDLSLAEEHVPHKINEINKYANVIWDIEEVTPTGATGDSTVASVEKGEAMLNHLVDIVCEGITLMNEMNWEYMK